MKKTTLVIYYSILIAFILAMVGQTIFVGSRHIDTGRKIAQLEKTKLDLAAQTQAISHQVGQELSIATLTTFAGSNGFTPISQVAIVHSNSTQVALR